MEWEDAFTVNRSYLDPAVWVPWGHGDWAGDYTSSLYAGGIRAVKAWARDEAASQVAASYRFRWVRENGDRWVLQAREGR